MEKKHILKCYVAMRQGINSIHRVDGANNAWGALNRYYKDRNIVLLQDCINYSYGKTIYYEIGIPARHVELPDIGFISNIIRASIGVYSCIGKISIIAVRRIDHIFIHKCLLDLHAFVITDNHDVRAAKEIISNLELASYVLRKYIIVRDYFDIADRIEHFSGTEGGQTAVYNRIPLDEVLDFIDIVTDSRK